MKSLYNKDSYSNLNDAVKDLQQNLGYVSTNKIEAIGELLVVVKKASLVNKRMLDETSTDNIIRIFGYSHILFSGAKDLRVISNYLAMANYMQFHAPFLWTNVNDYFKKRMESNSGLELNTGLLIKLLEYLTQRASPIVFDQELIDLIVDHSIESVISFNDFRLDLSVVPAS